MARRNDDILDRLMRSLSVRGILFHPATLFVFATSFLIGGAIFLWERHQDQIINLEEFRLTKDKITVTPPPAWANDDLKQLVLSESTDDLHSDAENLPSILDTQLVSRTATVIRNVGCVERVDSVRKSKSGLDIDVIYRVPVALVELSKVSFPFSWPKAKPDEQVLLPVDRLGVVMPQALGEGLSVPKILVVHPLASPSQALEIPCWADWPDERIKDAAAISALFETTANAIGFSRIVTRRKPDLSTGYLDSFELWPDRGTQVIWGNAPGKETKGEAKAEVKLRALEEFVIQYGALNKLSAQRVDVRTGVVVRSTDTKTAFIEQDLFVEIK